MTQPTAKWKTAWKMGFCLPAHDRESHQEGSVARDLQKCRADSQTGGSELTSHDNMDTWLGKVIPFWVMKTNLWQVKIKIDTTDGKQRVSEWSIFSFIVSYSTLV